MNVIVPHVRFFVSLLLSSLDAPSLLCWEKQWIITSPRKLKVRRISSEAREDLKVPKG